jgi:hypothetical protein
MGMRCLVNAQTTNRPEAVATVPANGAVNPDEPQATVSCPCLATTHYPPDWGTTPPARHSRHRCERPMKHLWRPARVRHGRHLAPWRQRRLCLTATALTKALPARIVAANSLACGRLESLACRLG